MLSITKQGEDSTNLESNPEVIKINADNQSKQHVCLQWMIYFGSIFIIFLCTLSLPDSSIRFSNSICNNEFTGDYDELFLILFFLSLLLHKTVQKNRCQLQADLISDPQGAYFQALYIRDFQAQQLFMIINADLRVSSLQDVSVIKQISYRVNIWEVSDGQNRITKQKRLYVEKKVKANINCYQVNGNDTYLSCDPLPVAYFPYLKGGPVVVEMFILSQSYITQFDITGVTASVEFTNALIAIRYFFLICSVITGLFYYSRYKKLKIPNRIIEQKLILILSILLFFFNDPFFAISVLYFNRVTAILDVLFVCTFTIFLLLYWMVSIDRMINENGIKQTKLLNGIKIIYCFILWICMIVSYSILEIQFYNDPTITYTTYSSKSFLAFKIITFILTGLIFLYIFINYCKYCRDYDRQIWRNKIIGLFQIYFVMVLVLSIYTGSFQMYQFSGNRVLLIFGFLNLYIYYMQFLWAPSQFGLAQQEFEDKVEIQLQSNNIYDQLDDEGIRVSFHDQDQIIIDEQNNKSQNLNSEKDLYKIEQ